MSRVPRSFARTLADLNTKLNRQKAAVEATIEMIEAVTALQQKENADAQRDTPPRTPKA